MSKSRKTSAAIVGLLDAIKFEGIEPVDDTNIMSSTSTPNTVQNSNISITSKRSSQDESTIPYQIKLIDTKLCKPWHLANRLREYLTPDSCADLIESLKKVGQQIPALVRKNNKGDGYELICGARRLFACTHLGIKIKAAIVDLSDKDALLAMDAENRPREDISPYERACDYKRWIDIGIYKNQVEIMHDIGVNKSWFSKLMALADLHEDIIKAFGHPANLKQKWGYHLQLICKSDPSLKANMLATARELIGQSLSPEYVFKKLKNPRLSETQNIYKELTWITNKHGEKLFQVKYSKKGLAHIAFNKQLPKPLIDRLIESTKGILEE